MPTRFCCCRPPPPRQIRVRSAARQLATQRGLVEKSRIITATMERLRIRVEQVQETLARLNPESAPR